MFYYENNDGSFEKSMQDYISSASRISYEIGKGWPEFSLSDLEETKGIDGQEYGFDPNALLEIEATGTKTLEIQEADRLGDTVLNEISFFEREMDHMKRLTGELAKKIIPIIDEVLNEYDHEGSPLFEDSIDDKLLYELVEKSMQHAALLIKDIKDIMLEAKGGAWDRRDILYSVFEEVTIKEIFAVRRHHHRHVMGLML